MEDSRREEADSPESPVARILLANYKVIGKLFRGKTRLAALYLITSNKRYSPPRFLSLSTYFFLFFFSIFFFLFDCLSFFRSTHPIFLSIRLLPLLREDPHFLSLFRHAANVLSCVILNRFSRKVTSPRTDSFFTSYTEKPISTIFSLDASQINGCCH